MGLDGSRVSVVSGSSVTMDVLLLLANTAMMEGRTGKLEFDSDERVDSLEEVDCLSSSEVVASSERNR